MAARSRLRAYIDGRRVIAIAAELGVTRGSVNRWLQWYDTDHVEGLRTKISDGPAPKLNAARQAELADIIECGPLAAGYQSGVWTGPMIGDLIEQRFGVRYHNHHVPRLLHQLGFSVQRRASGWLAPIWSGRPRGFATRCPRSKKARQCRGVVAFGDEASFWLDGTLHRTWSRVGQQPRVDTFGMRKTAHVFGIVTLEGNTSRCPVLTTAG